MAYAARHPDYPSKLVLQSTMARLVIAGEADPVCTVESAEEIVAALRSAQVRFERLPGAGHFAHLDDPDRFFRILRDFLG